MLFKPKLSFSGFKIEVYKKLRDGFYEKDYKEYVGKEARRFRDKFYPIKTGQNKIDWYNWITAAKIGVDIDSWLIIKNFNENKIGDLSRGKGNIIFAYAVHYRLHMYTNDDERGFADEIDTKVFGKPLHQSGLVVFERIAVALEPTAPFKWPDHVSEEDARREDAPEGIWLNPHNHHSLPLSGRDEEWRLLDDFINHGRHFLVGALVAPSGAGKTRLVSEWMTQYMAKYDDSGWDAGFVDSRDASRWREGQGDDQEEWNPTKNTLIIIDYTYNYSEVMGAIFNRFKDGSPKTIRLLILDHLLPNQLHSDIAWRGISSDAGGFDTDGDAFFRPFPIVLKPEADNSILLRDVIAWSADRNREKGYNRDSPVVVNAAEALMEIGNVSTESPTADQIRTRDSIRHPLFAALIGQAVGENPDQKFTGWTRRDLITRYFERTQRIPWQLDERNKYAETLGPWVGCYVCTATLLRGSAVLAMEAHLPEAVKEHIADSDQLSALTDYSNRIVSGDSDFIIKPFEPDILGEAFLLKFIERFRTKRSVIETFFSMLASSGSRTQDEANAMSFLETLQRLVRNLINDDQETKSVKASWIALSVLLSQTRFPEETLMRQAVSIALCDIIKQCRAVGLYELIPNFASKIEAAYLRDASKDVLWFHSAVATLHYFDFMKSNTHCSELVDSALFDVFTDFPDRRKSSWSALSLAAVEGCEASAVAIKEFFEEDVNACVYGGITALIAAVHGGHINIVRWLLRIGADIDGREPQDGMAPLLVASFEGNLPMVRFLVEHGADVELSSIKLGMNSLIAACTNGHLSVVEYLIRSGANVNYGARFHDRTALVDASAHGHSTIVKLLIAAGARVNQRTGANGETALIATSRKGDLATVRLLVAEGADVNQRTSTDRATALMWASSNGHLPVVEFLVAQGAKVDSRTKSRGATALMMACACGHISIVQFLIHHGAKINRRLKENGLTALCCASERGYVDIVKILVSGGAEINSGTSVTERTALMLACSGGSVSVAKYLLSKGANVDQGTAVVGETALMMASAIGNVSIVELLIEHGANVNKCTEDNGVSPLMMSVSYGHLAVLEALLNAKADPNIVSMDEGTALDMAIEFGHTQIIDRLRKVGAMREFPENNEITIGEQM